MGAVIKLRQALDLFREGDYPRAQMLLETLTLDELDGDLQIEAHYLWGRVLVSRGDPMEAAGHFQAALRLSPQYFPALDAWGNVLASMGDARGAIEKYRRVLQLAPAEQTAHVLFNYGTVLLQHGAVKRALARFRECFKRDNKRADAAYGAADCYLRLNRSRGALKWLRIAATLEPKNAKVQVAMGNAYALAGKTEQSLSCYKHAVLLDIACSDAYYNWAVALARTGDFGGAIRQCKAGLKQNSEAFELHVEQLFCLRKMGAFDAALQVARRARAVLKGAPSERRGEFADLVACNEAACRRELGRMQEARVGLIEFLANALDQGRHSLAELRFITMQRVPRAKRIELTLNVRRADENEEASPIRYRRTYWVIAHDLAAARKLARELEAPNAEVRFENDTRVIEELTDADTGVVERTAALALLENQ